MNRKNYFKSQQKETPYIKLMNLFIFHRDLRLLDNTALIKQIKSFGKITPIFIFPPEQIEPKQNKYFSNNSVQFMIQSLKELGDDIAHHGGRFYFFKGENLQVLQNIQENIKIQSIGFNLDYTPYAKKRDKEIGQWAKKNGIKMVETQDYGMYEHLKNQTVNPKSDKPYLVYTPFRNFCMNNFKVPKPDPFSAFQFHKDEILQKIDVSFNEKNLDNLYEYNPNILVRGGRKNALKILSQIKKFAEYNKTRNTPVIPTTRLSAYLHFTTVSIRQVYHTVADTLGVQNNIINQIHWREFYTYIAHHFPKVLQGRSLEDKFDQIKWNYNEHHMQAWKTGNTGFPIVDAAMRQLNTTGYMHNRCRMIVASFLAKDLFLDWHEAERYFATKLTDYSPMQNAGGWQWTVGNGTDAASYFRIFNPWLQQKEHDKECKYIKKWIPELENVSNEDIHSWFRTHKAYKGKQMEYPSPIIDHYVAKDQTLEILNQHLRP